MDGDFIWMNSLSVAGKKADRDAAGSNKMKVVCAVQLSRQGKLKRFYALSINDFSARSFSVIFDKHIDRCVDEWREYSLIAREYRIKQMPSNGELNFKTLHK